MPLLLLLRRLRRRPSVWAVLVLVLVLVLLLVAVLVLVLLLVAVLLLPTETTVAAYGGEAEVVEDEEDDEDAQRLLLHETAMDTVWTLLGVDAAQLTAADCSPRVHCALAANWTDLTLRRVAAPAVCGRDWATRNCALWQVVDPSGLFARRSPWAQPAQEEQQEEQQQDQQQDQQQQQRRRQQFVALQGASDWRYVAAARHRLNVLSLCAYAGLHGLRQFLYVGAAGAEAHWFRILVAKGHGVLTMVDRLEAEDAPEQGVWWTDLDGWFNLAPRTALSIDVVATRVLRRRQQLVRGLHGTAPAADVADLRFENRVDGPRIDLLLQGEPNLCSCTFVLFRGSDYALSFFDRVFELCAEPKLLVPHEVFCQRHVYDQYAFYRLVLRAMHGTGGFAVLPNVCSDGINTRCQYNAFRAFVRGGGGSSISASSSSSSSSSNSSDANDDADDDDDDFHDVGFLNDHVWPNVAFVPYDGTAEQPQLHACLGLWFGCNYAHAIWYHVGSTNMPRYRDVLADSLAFAVYSAEHGQDLSLADPVSYRYV